MDIQRSGGFDHQFRSAIRNKRLIQLRYHGRSRVAEPHDYGINKGTARLLVYQLRAPVDRPGRSVKGWRLLDVSQIEDCVVLDEAFPGSRGTSHHNHMEWDVLYARVG